MQEKVLKIASDVFSTPINRDDKIGCCEAWDSLGQLNLFMALEGEFGVKFSPDEIINTDSIEAIVELIKSKNG